MDEILHLLFLELHILLF